MDSLSATQIISLIIAFVSDLLAIFLLTAKTKNFTSNLLLALFLFVNAQDSSGLFASYFVYPNFPGLGMLINSTVFLKLPLLYLYISSVVYSDFKLRNKHFWHLIPFLLNFLIFIPRYYAVDFDAKWVFLNTSSFDRMPEIKFSYVLVHLQILVYVIMSFKLIKKYKILLLENYSNASLFNYKWLYQLVIIFSIEAFIATFKNVFMFMHLEMVYHYTLLFTTIFALAFICWMVLKALHSPELFRGIDSKLQLVKNLVIENIQSGEEISFEKDSKDFGKIIELKKYMVEEKPYLEATLTINDLSNKLNIPVRDLSLLINHNLNQHFFDFVNSYRIKKAMEILTDPNKKELTVLEVLYEVGFNSKSSFNTAFKNYTGLTPTEYRQKLLKSVA